MVFFSFANSFKLAAPLLALALLGSCSARREAVDLLVTNATVYTVDSTFSKAEAFAVQDGKFVAVGSASDLKARYSAAKEVDAKGQFIYPGFYDAHCHFYRYAVGLVGADLAGTKSWAQVIEKLQETRRKYPKARWLTGWGWDQNDWRTKEFPTKDTLDLLFPDVPVFITRVDGHAALVNQKLLDLAGITARTPISGGVIGRDAQGRLTGLLVDMAQGLVGKVYPVTTAAEDTPLLMQAQQNCLAVGLTSLAEAGLERADIAVLDSLQKQDQLHLRINAMVRASPANVAYYLKNGPILTDRLTVNSFKAVADGALGSRGACLLKPYDDKPKETGYLYTVKELKEYRELAKKLAASKFQLNTHAIGDSTNRLVLNIYGEVLEGRKDRRWRIEHAQIVTPADMPKFGQFGIVPSVQPTHATSDMYWADERLGAARLKTAYAYAELLKQYGQLALGSDFPVENINPLFGFHSAVARQDAKNFPKNGFQMENAISRPDALRGMTTWAAHAGFEEKRKGQIKPGMLADFVVLNTDLLTAPNEQLRGAKVLQTWIGGQAVFVR